MTGHSYLPGTARFPTPVAPLPGDPVQLRATATRLATAAGGLDAAVRTMPAGCSDWAGAAAGAFRAALSVQTTRVAACSDALNGAGTALARYADDLAVAQALAGRATAGGTLAAGADPGLLSVAEQARARARESAQRATATIGALAHHTPPPAARLERWSGRLREWQSELGLGADEAFAGLVGLVTRWNGGRLVTDPVGYARDSADAATALVEGVQHPGSLLADLLDADTWRSNPVRAVGHLLPDLVAAAATGGSATLARRSLALAARDTRQAGLRAASATSRRTFVNDLAPPSRLPTATAGWQGEGGLRLGARAEGMVDAYWAAVQPFEPALTAHLRALADDLGARLEGLGHRVKTLDSLKRKVADGMRRGRSVEDALHGAGDTLRYTLVFPERQYVKGIRRVAEQLDRADTALTLVRNSWAGRRYRAVNTTWTQAGSGLRFEVQFHTPATWRATVLTHPWYETFRLPDTPTALKAELESRIAAEYATAAAPRGVGGVSTSTVPAPATVEWPVAPVAGAVGAAQSGTGAARSRPGTHRRHPDLR